VVITGDVTVDAAVAAVARTFGALPPRPALPVLAQADRVAFPADSAAPVTRLHQGRPDQAVAYMAWPATDLLSDPQRARRINIAGAVMQLRLLDKVRVAEGASYSPAAGASESDTFPGYGYLYANVEIPPAKVDGFWADASAIAADLAAHDVGGDELRRAVQPRIEAIAKAKQTNAYWTLMLHDADRDPRRLDLIRTSPGGYDAITPADVRAAARAYLDPARAWRFQVLPTQPAPEVRPAMALPAPKADVSRRAAPPAPGDRR
jgi:zinc protease